MAKLPILTFPDPRLRTKARPVARVDDKVRQLIDDMLETMYAAPGIGLAASQVNVHRRVIVVDVSAEHDQPLALVNPVIDVAEGMQEREEGCLSVPGVFEEVSRAERITVRALDPHGESLEMDAEGLLAICIQHEMDHLDGSLFLDRLRGVRREMMLRKLNKLRRSGKW